MQCMWGKIMILLVTFIFLLIVFSIYDIRTMHLPIWIVSINILISILAIALDVMKGKRSLTDYGLTLFLTVIILMTSVFFKILKIEAIGFGDGLIMISINLCFGAENAIVIFCISFLLSAIISGVLMVIKKVNRKTRIPFVPFLTTGTLIQLMFIYMGEIGVIQI